MTDDSAERLPAWLVLKRQAEGCPDAVLGKHGPPDNAGTCPWCGRKVTGAMPKLRAPASAVGHTELDDAYRYAYGQDDPYDGREEFG